MWHQLAHAAGREAADHLEGFLVEPRTELVAPAVRHLVRLALAGLGVIVLPEQLVCAIVQSVRLVVESIVVPETQGLEGRFALQSPQDLDAGVDAHLVLLGGLGRLGSCLRGSIVRLVERPLEHGSQVAIRRFDQFRGRQGREHVGLHAAEQHLAAAPLQLLLRALEEVHSRHVDRWHFREAEDAMLEVWSYLHGLRDDRGEILAGAEEQLALQIQDCDLITLHPQALELPDRAKRAAHRVPAVGHAADGVRAGALPQEQEQRQAKADANTLEGRRKGGDDDAT
mmetsp:Transcript_19899/g.40156  ORF Transcript_19899/g.40156 Transcript_19899/m.40156 type:complete len:284 (+) Transcript_19899:412-1263(+)